MSDPATSGSFHAGSPSAERSTWWVVAITVVMMVVEIIGGWWFNSMAVLADGWHMSSHALGIGLPALAYAVARRHADDPRYAFGTWKVEVLGGFASAVFLLGVAGLMLAGSVERLLRPEPIIYGPSLLIAAVGLVVNIVCAWLLAGAHGHDHGHGPSGHDGNDGHGAHAAHDHARHKGHHHAHDHHHDLNLRSAYLHVLADAATSVLALVALAGAWLWGWVWLDPAMGVVGAVLVALWSFGLLRQTSAVLLDREMDHPVVEEIREVVSELPGAARLLDLRVWRVGRQAYACTLVISTADASLTPAEVRRRLAVHDEVVHATVEVRQAAEDGRIGPS